MGVKLGEVVRDSWQQEAVLLATILDPGVKLGGFVSAGEKQSAVSLLKKNVEAYSARIPSTGGQSVSVVPVESIRAD